MKEIKLYNTLKIVICASETGEEYFDAASVEEYADDILVALQNEDTDLAPYADDYHGDTFYKKLHHTDITVEWIDHKLYGLCTCEVDDDWTDSDTEQLKKYLTGQYSDGWGEGFEQHSINGFSELESCEEYDEDTGEYYTSEYTEYYDVYVSFWQSRDFKIMTDNEFNI